MNRLREFGDGEMLAAALAASVAGKLAAAIDANGVVRLAVSGGKTPVRFFEQLSEHAIDWAHVVVTLVDERLVPPTHERSNERLVRTHLLRGKAANARFVRLHRDSFEVAEEIFPIDVAVLGLGLDGHTASWFPDAPALATAIEPDAPDRIAEIDAPSAPERRVTLTLPALVDARALYLHLEGRDKLAVLERALAPDADPRALPVAALLRAAEVSIYWSP